MMDWEYYFYRYIAIITALGLDEIYSNAGHNARSYYVMILSFRGTGYNCDCNDAGMGNRNFLL